MTSWRWKVNSFLDAREDKQNLYFHNSLTVISERRGGRSLTSPKKKHHPRQVSWGEKKGSGRCLQKKKTSIVSKAEGAEEESDQG